MRFLLIIASAVLTGLCFAFYKVGFLALFTVIPLFYVILSEAEKDKKPFRFYGYGYLWGGVFFACIFYWFSYQYPLEYLNFTKGEAVAYVALSWFGTGLLLSVLLALWPFLTGLFVRTKLCRKYPWLFIPFTSCLYVIVEYLFTLGSLASPWARLAITQQSNILGIQTASLFGSYFISFIVISINAALAYGLYEFLKRKNRKTALICLISSASLFFTNMGVGGILYAADKSKTAVVETYVTAAAYQIAAWEQKDAERFDEKKADARAMEISGMRAFRTYMQQQPGSLLAAARGTALDFTHDAMLALDAAFTLRDGYLRPARDALKRAASGKSAEFHRMANELDHFLSAEAEPPRETREALIKSLGRYVLAESAPGSRDHDRTSTLSALSALRALTSDRDFARLLETVNRGRDAGAQIDAAMLDALSEQGQKAEPAAAI